MCDVAITEKNPIIELKDVKMSFKSKRGHETEVLKAITLDVYNNEILGLLGESGCGKTTLSKIIIGLENMSSGEFYFESEIQENLDKKSLFERRKKIQMIFQDPFLSIDPTMYIREVIEEPMISLRPEWNKNEREKRISDIMELVGLDKSYLEKKSKYLSGGQLQRVGIARALICNPKVVICDEPVSALDVSVQAQILNLLKNIKRELGIAMIFISHDLGVIRYLTDRVCVMLDGKICESGNTEKVFKNPTHEYTKYLLDSVPRINI